MQVLGELPEKLSWPFHPQDLAKEKAAGVPAWPQTGTKPEPCHFPKELRLDKTVTLS